MSESSDGIPVFHVPPIVTFTKDELVEELISRSRFTLVVQVDDGTEGRVLATGYTNVPDDRISQRNMLHYARKVLLDGHTPGTSTAGSP